MEVVRVGDFSVLFSLLFFVWFGLCLSVSGAALTEDEIVVYCVGQVLMGCISSVGSVAKRWGKSFLTSVGRGSLLTSAP